MATIAIKSFLVGIPIGIAVFDYIGYVARVDGISMRPTLNPTDDSNDYVYLSKWSVNRYNVDRGDIVSMVSPKDPKQRIIKRIIAKQGDVISTNGYYKPYVKVPEGHCWVEGDYKGNSLDSNTFGPISLGLLTARAKYIVWPPSRWGSISQS